MRRLILLGLILIGWTIPAAQIQSVKVGGEKEARIVFVGSSEKPTTRYIDNTIELLFPETTLLEALQGKVDIDAPHTLIRRISLFETGQKAAKAIIVLNGAADNLKDRFTIAAGGEGVEAKVSFPKGQNAALSILEEEQLPVMLAETKKESPKLLPKAHLFFSLVVILAAGIVTFLAMKFLKNKGNFRGSRKFLIEQLGYSPVGPKAGVSLLKIGKEFILVGVTPNQVTLLSTLPKLAEQYEEEAHFERGVFKEAVEEGMRSESAYNV